MEVAHSEWASALDRRRHARRQVHLTHDLEREREREREKETSREKIIILNERVKKPLKLMNAPCVMNKRRLLDAAARYSLPDRVCVCGIHTADSRLWIACLWR